MHPDDHVVIHLRPVDQGAVAHGNPFAQGQPKALVRVEHGAVLDVGTGADDDGLGVAPDHRTVPDRGVPAQGHIADDGGVVRHKAGIVDLRGLPLKSFDHGAPHFIKRGRSRQVSR